MGAMTILSSVMQFAMMPMQGVAQGAQPIISYNFGAKNKTRVVKINVDISNYENVLQDCKKIDMICEQREKIAIIERTVKSMKEDDIFIFNCYYYSSMKMKEIANALNISEFNVKSKLYRIRKKIKSDLMKGGYSDGQ